MEMTVSFTYGATDGTKAHAWRSDSRLFGFGIERLGHRHRQRHGLEFGLRICEPGLVLMDICGRFTLEALATRGRDWTDGVGRGERKFVVFFGGAGVRTMNWIGHSSEDLRAPQEAKT